MFKPQAVERFYTKHFCQDIYNIDLNYYNKIYLKLPTLITTLPVIPDIKDFIRDPAGICDNDFVSKIKTEVNVINTKNLTVSNMFAYLHVSFSYDHKNRKHYPVHIFRIDLENALHRFTFDLVSKTFY